MKLMDLIAAPKDQPHYETAVRNLVHWADSNDIKPVRPRNACAGHWLKGKRCPHGFIIENCWPPGYDHVSWWKKDGKPFAFVFHPYDMGWEKLSELVDWAREWGMVVNIDASSWHYPGWTTRVVITVDQRGTA